MHRIDGPGATVDNHFTDGDPVGGVQATVVTDEWLNAVQEEVIAVIADPAVTPAIPLDKAANNQLVTAIKRLISSGYSQATELLAGISKIATQAQTNAGTDDATVVTPKKLKNGFLFSISTNGYIIFPSWAGGFGVQWGVVASLASGVPLTQALPVSFANNLLWCLAAGSDAVNNNALACNAAPISTSSIRLAQAYGSAMSARYVAIGN